MKTINIKDAVNIKNPHGIEAKELHNNKHTQVMHIALEPGQKLVKHITPVDVFFYVLEGQGTVEIGDEKKIVGKDTLVDSPKKIPHCWHNTGDTKLQILVVKTPKPTEKTIILE